MVIEITGETYNAWIIALEPLAEKDSENKIENYPDGGKVMTPQVVLGFLENNAHGIHLIEIDELHPDLSHKTRWVATGNTVQLDNDSSDEDFIRQIIDNAERITDIKAEYSSRDAKNDLGSSL
jgi:hypothetical protein